MTLSLAAVWQKRGCAHSYCCATWRLDYATGVPDMGQFTREADILVGAAGVPGIIQPDMVRPGAAVVGGGQSYQGKRALSDVDESVGEVAGWVTPRIGGVGPTTVAMLFRNTVEAAERRATA